MVHFCSRASCAVTNPLQHISASDLCSHISFCHQLVLNRICLRQFRALCAVPGWNKHWSLFGLLDFDSCWSTDELIDGEKCVLHRKSGFFSTLDIWYLQLINIFQNCLDKITISNRGSSPLLSVLITSPFHSLTCAQSFQQSASRLSASLPFFSYFPVRLSYKGLQVSAYIQ